MAIGYRQAKRLLEEGNEMIWHHYPASKATINGQVIRYDAYLKLTAEGYKKPTISLDQ